MAGPETPAPAPTTPITLPEAMPGIARPDLQALAQEVYDTNTTETIELVQALRELREYLDNTYTEPVPGSKAILKQAIHNAMAALSDVKGVERNPASTKEEYETVLTLLRDLNDGQQNFMAIFQNPRHGLKDNTLVNNVGNAFDEKIAALTTIKQNIEAGNFIPTQQPPAAPVAAPAPAEGASAPVVTTDASATAPAEAPEVPLTPEQQAFSDAVDADKKVSIKFAELLAKTHEDFITHMEALKAEAPTTTNDVNQGLATFAASVLAIENGLREVDQLILIGNTQVAFTKLDGWKTDLGLKLDGAIQQLTTSRDKKKLGLGLNDEEKAIVDQAIASLTEAKTNMAPLIIERTQSIAVVASKVEVLAQQKAPLPAVIFSPETQQAAGAVETRLSTLQQNVPALDNDPEHMTAEEFMDSIQNTWEEVNEAMQAKEWGAVLAGLVAMIAVIAGRLGSLDSIGDLVDFVGDYGKKKEGEEGAPEKPTDIPQVLAQFGIENDTKRDEFTALKLSEVARFIEQDGVLPSGEPAYPQPLVDLKANQADAYGKLKAQLELNGFEAYHDGLPDADKTEKTLGDFITYRFNSDETKEEGWKT